MLGKPSLPSVSVPGWHLAVWLQDGVQPKQGHEGQIDFCTIMVQNPTAS